jgi:hypothetical protein
MNAPVPATQFAVEIDPRAALLARASAMDMLYTAGEIDLDTAFDRLVDPFLAIVGPEPKLCRHCGDPPWRHDDSWCTASREGEARRRAERAKPRPKPPTPQPTIEAIMHAVRTNGVAALKHPDNLERLQRCDDRARAEIDARISALVNSGKTIA